jgi:hypothetical protein
VCAHTAWGLETVEHLHLTVDLLVAETTRYADRLARTDSLVVSVGATSPHR